MGQAAEQPPSLIDQPLGSDPIDRVPELEDTVRFQCRVCAAAEFIQLWMQSKLALRAPDPALVRFQPVSPSSTGRRRSFSK